jgi:hypothetical protein
MLHQQECPQYCQHGLNALKGEAMGTFCFSRDSERIDPNHPKRATFTTKRGRAPCGRVD